jgi:hypothetical protein
MGSILDCSPTRAFLPLLWLCGVLVRLMAVYSSFCQEVSALSPVDPDEQWRRGFLGDTPPVWLASSDEVGLLLTPFL